MQRQLSAWASLAADLGGGDGAWVNPNNALGPNDSVYAVGHASSGGADTTNLLRLTGYGFGVPAGAQITKVTVIAWGFSLAGDQWRASLTMAKGVSPLQALVQVPTSNAAATLGTVPDLYGFTGISAADVNDSAFGARIYGVASVSADFSVDAVQVVIDYLDPGVLTAMSVSSQLRT